MNDTPSFDIEQFSPKKAELAAVAKKYEGLTIAGIDDIEGQKRVSEARKDLKSIRIDIEKRAKEARDPAIAFQKKIIEIEKELVGIVAPVEKALEAQEDKVAAEKRRILEEEAARQRAELNRRVSELAKVGYGHDIEELRVMLEIDFEILLAEKTADFNEAMERKQAEDRAAVSAVANASISGVIVGTVSLSQESDPTPEPIRAETEAKAQRLSASVDDQFERFKNDRGITEFMLSTEEIIQYPLGDGRVAFYKKMAVFVPANPA